MARLTYTLTGGAADAVGGGGGGGEDEEMVHSLEMDTSMGPGMLNLDPESGYPTGAILIITSSLPPGGGFIFPTFGDTIGGEMNRQLGANETLILQASGTGDFTVLGSSPSLVGVELAEGGDTYTLPSLASVPANYMQLVVFNIGAGTVIVEPAEGDTLTGGDQTIANLYESRVFYNSGIGSWEPHTQTSAIPAAYSPTYALEYGLAQGALVSGSEMSVHHLNCSDPSDATVTSLSVSGASWETPPSAAVRGARAATNVFGGGPLVMSPAGPTAPNADRAFELVFKLTASRTQNYVALGQWGTYSTAECLGLVRAAGDVAATQSIDFQAGAGNAAGTGNTLRLWDDTALIQNLWCYVVGNYDATAGQFTLYWWADGDGGFSSDTLAFANAGTGTAQPIYAGGNGASFYTWPGHYAYIGLHNAQLSEAYRNAMRAALGLT